MQKFVNLVDLVKGFPTTICLQRFVSIQPRTSLSKFAKNSPNVLVRKTVRQNIGFSRALPSVKSSFWREPSAEELSGAFFLSHPRVAVTS